MTPAEPRAADREAGRVDLVQIQVTLEFPPKPIAHGFRGYWRQVILDLAADVARLEGERVDMERGLVAARRRAEDAERDIDQVRVENARLRGALEWYANDRNYSEDTGAAGTFHRIPSTPDQAPGEFAFEPDCGDVARAALGTKGTGNGE